MFYWLVMRFVWMQQHCAASDLPLPILVARSLLLLCSNEVHESLRYVLFLTFSFHFYRK